MIWTRVAHHVLVCFLELLEWKDLLVDHRLDVGRFDRRVHLLKLNPASNQHTSDDTAMRQDIQEPRLSLARPTGEEANDCDDALPLNRYERLLHCFRTSDLDHKVDAIAIRRQLLSRLTPVLVLLVIDYVIRPEIFERLGFFRGRCRRDDSSASGFGELEGEDTDTSRPLSQDGLPIPELPAFDAIECVPSGQCCAGQGACLFEVEIFRRRDQVLLVPYGVLAQDAVDSSSGTTSHKRWGQCACDKALVEQRDDVVAGLEARHARTDSDDSPSAVRCRYYILLCRERICALWS